MNSRQDIFNEDSDCGLHARRNGKGGRAFKSRSSVSSGVRTWQLFQLKRILSSAPIGCGSKPECLRGATKSSILEAERQLKEELVRHELKTPDTL